MNSHKVGFPQEQVQCVQLAKTITKLSRSNKDENFNEDWSEVNRSHTDYACRQPLWQTRWQTTQWRQRPTENIQREAENADDGVHSSKLMNGTQSSRLAQNQAQIIGNFQEW